MADIHNIIRRLEELDTISSQLDVPEKERSSYMEKMSSYLNHFINGLPEIIAFREAETPSDALRIDLKKKNLEEALTLYQKEVIEKGIVASSGGHLGYIPGGGIFTAGLADLLAAITNPYAGIFFASPGAAQMETEVLNWLKKIFSFPETATGNLASGGSLSTLIALTAARDKQGIKNELVPRSVVYLSKQVHHSTQKALRIIGLGDVIIRYIPLDERHRLKAEPLLQQIVQDKEAGLKPFLVVASAGTTDTGAIDPLAEIAEIASKHNLWLHVDAAYGGFFILTSKKDLFKGIEKADSLIVDPHKGLFLPYGLGAVLIKDRQAALFSNQYVANYMQDAQDEELVSSPANVSPELTKHFRGLRIWLPLQLHGIEPFIACLEEKLLLCTYFREQLVQRGFQVGPTPDLSVSYFWYPFEKEADEKNKQLMKAIHEDGRVFLSSSVIDQRFVIRMAILAFRTKRFTIDRALQMIDDCLEKILEQENVA